MPPKKVTKASDSGAKRKREDTKTDTTDGEKKKRGRPKKQVVADENKEKAGSPPAKKKNEMVAKGNKKKEMNGEEKKEKGDSSPIKSGDGADGVMETTNQTSKKLESKLEGPNIRGQLLVFGLTNWDLSGRDKVPKGQKAGGETLWSPHRYSCLNDVLVSCVVSGPCAAHNLLITAEGKLWSWGRNEKGQLGHGDLQRVDEPKMIQALEDEVVVGAACGQNHTLALTENGTVFSFGDNKSGQLGQGSKVQTVMEPARLQYNGSPLVKVACGADFSMVVDCDGNLYSFGHPEYGQLGHNSDGKYLAKAQKVEWYCELFPRRVVVYLERTKEGEIIPVTDVVVKDVACGANHTVVMDSKKRVFSWGCGGYGRLGHAETKDEMVPRLIKVFDLPARGATSIYAGRFCSFAVNESGILQDWGIRKVSGESTMYPKPVMDLSGWKIRSLASGKTSVIVAADDSTITYGFSPTFGELGHGDGTDGTPKTSSRPKKVEALEGIYVEQVTMGISHSLVIARQDNEQELEKLRKLPEYNPKS